jgi:hypothetical protein
MPQSPFRGWNSNHDPDAPSGANKILLGFAALSRWRHEIAPEKIVCEIDDRRT